MRDTRGVTLVALVITIIMLILIGVTIKLTLGENGIFNKAQTASEETIKQAAIDSISLKVTTIQIMNIQLL